MVTASHRAGGCRHDARGNVRGSRDSGCRRIPVPPGRLHQREADAGRDGSGQCAPGRAGRERLPEVRDARASRALPAGPVRRREGIHGPAVQQGGLRPQVVAGPALVSTHEFAGIDEASAGGSEPPDPWVAVNSSSIVQSTNGLVRISDRNGIEKASIATWAMFNVYPGYLDTDPRIIWDAYHGRWVGVLAWFFPDLSDNYLTVIVSETSDPLGNWDSFLFSYGSNFPDYPAVASSTDKIVVPANEYADG